MLVNLTITVETEHLKQVAKLRGISRTRLVQLMMEKIVREERAGELVTAAEAAASPRHQPYYRRFPPNT